MGIKPGSQVTATLLLDGFEVRSPPTTAINPIVFTKWRRDNEEIHRNVTGDNVYLQWYQQPIDDIIHHMEHHFNLYNTKGKKAYNGDIRYGINIGNIRYEFEKSIKINGIKLCKPSGFTDDMLSRYYEVYPDKRIPYHPQQVLNNQGEVRSEWVQNKKSNTETGLNIYWAYKEDVIRGAMETGEGTDIKLIDTIGDADNPFASGSDYYSHFLIGPVMEKDAIMATTPAMTLTSNEWGLNKENQTTDWKIMVEPIRVQTWGSYILEGVEFPAVERWGLGAYENACDQDLPMEVMEAEDIIEMWNDLRTTWRDTTLELEAHPLDPGEYVPLLITSDFSPYGDANLKIQDKTI